MTVGQRIQQIRVAAGLSQEQFGQALETTRQTVSKWELDQGLPEIAKIVKISRMFSVSTDSILIDGITTFDFETDRFVCGVYRSPISEIVETERFALHYYCSRDKSVLGVKFYSGFRQHKRLCALCERDQAAAKTYYAIETDGGGVISNKRQYESILGAKFDSSVLKSMRRLEKFYVDHNNVSLPKVS